MMNTTLSSRSIRCVLVLVSLIAFSHSSVSQVSIRDTSWTWQHFAYTLNPDYTIATFSDEQIVDRTFHGKVIENKWIKIVTLAEFGGRVLSYIYKPTGHEQLYQNPIGTPYLIGNNFFYYDWLMVYGGIFPTFPEPEHGKAWLLPWDEVITDNSPEKVTVQMSFTDNIDNAAPWGFDNGQTDITCYFSVSVYEGRSDIEIDVKLVNNKNQPVVYEYWTNGTLAPGSIPGDPKCTDQAEIIAPMEQARLKDDWWPWMGSAETPVDAGNHVFEWNNLAQYKNWDGWGITYAYPSFVEDYYGLINHENEEGIFRVGDNLNHTVGLKKYTFGYELSRDADPANFYQIERPFIELWSGVTSEFFYDAVLQPNETKAWTSYYLPSVGLPAVTNVERAGEVLLAQENDHLSAQFFGTQPGEELTVELGIRDQLFVGLTTQTFVVDPAEPATWTVARDDINVPAGSYMFIGVIKDSQGNTLLEGEIPVELGPLTNGVAARFDLSTSEVGVGEGITVTDQSEGDITGYAWDFGEGANPASAMGAGPHQVSFDSPGEKIVSLTVTGQDAEDHYFQTVQVNGGGCNALHRENLNNEAVLSRWEDRSEIGNHFIFSSEDGAVKIQSDGLHDEYDDFIRFSLSPEASIDASSNPALYLRLKASVPMGLRVTLEDVLGRQALNAELAGNLGSYEPGSFDLSVGTSWEVFRVDFENRFYDNWSDDGGGPVDGNQIKSVILRPNPGYQQWNIYDFNTAFNGSLYVDYVVLGDTADCFSQYDCEGVLKGNALVDACGRCTAGSTGLEPATDPAACGVLTSANVMEGDASPLSVFPNPSQGTFVIDYVRSEVLAVELLDAQGVVRYSDAAPAFLSGSHELNVPDLPSGIYQLLLRTTSGSQTTTIVLF